MDTNLHLIYMVTNYNFVIIFHEILTIKKYSENYHSIVLTLATVVISSTKFATACAL
jgi:hypothetical protein